MERGFDVPKDLLGRFDVRNAATNVELVAEAVAVSSILDRAGIEGVVLGEAARQCLDGKAAGYDASNDIDMLVPADLADAAVSALRTAGYDERNPTDTLAPVKHRGLRRPPLRAEGRHVSVTICDSLAATGTTSERLDYGAIAERTRLVDSEAGSIRVLTPPLGALGVAYAARDFAMLRDAVALMRRLVSLSAEDRIEFDRLVACECDDAVRLRSAVAAADCLVRESVLPRPIARYLSWIATREDLPRLLRNRARLFDGLEADASRGRSGRLAMPGGLLERIADLAAVPIFLRWRHWSNAKFGPGSALFGSTETDGQVISGPEIKLT
jgi:hypothetical protein